MTEEHTPTPAPAASQTGCANAGHAAGSPAGVAAAAATSIDAASTSTRRGPFDTRWPRITYSMNNAQLANANANPSGWPASLTAVIAATPAVVSTTAVILRPVRAPAAARSTVPPNSIAPTVASGNRATAR